MLIYKHATNPDWRLQSSQIELSASTVFVSLPVFIDPLASIIPFPFINVHCLCRINTSKEFLLFYAMKSNLLAVSTM